MSTTGPVRVIFAGGGTGGHLFPGIAVARELMRRHPTAEVVFAGSGRDLETRVLSREGFSLERVRAVGLVGRSPRAVLRGLAQLPAAFVDATRVLRRHRPDVVVGLGGYSSGPVVLWAAFRHIPTLLLEQNAVPGMTNRLLSRFARAAAVSFEDTLSHFGTRGFVSGNPVRTEFFDAPPAREELPEVHLLVIGGSQGAHAINVAMVGVAPAIAMAAKRVHVTHQSGEADLTMVRDGYRSAGLAARVEPFLDLMSVEMSKADIVVCRAGATTLAELAAAGRPAILVPFPHAAHDHQRLNAAAVEKTGAAQVIDPDELSSAELAGRLTALMTNDADRVALARASRRRAMPDAASRIVDLMDRLMGRV